MGAVSHPCVERRWKCHGRQVRARARQRSRPRPRPLRAASSATRRPSRLAHCAFPARRPARTEEGRNRETQERASRQSIGDPSAPASVARGARPLPLRELSCLTRSSPLALAAPALATRFYSNLFKLSSSAKGRKRRCAPLSEKRNRALTTTPRARRGACRRTLLGADSMTRVLAAPRTRGSRAARARLMCLRWRPRALRSPCGSGAARAGRAGSGRCS